MKQDLPHTDPQLRPLLDALRQHGRNQRRQQALSEKIDQLAGLSTPGASPRPTSNAPAQSRRKQSRWIWVAVSAAAVALVLLIVASPSSPSGSPSPVGWIAENQCIKEISQGGTKEALPLAPPPQQNSHPQRAIAPQMDATSSAATILHDGACSIPDTLSLLDVAAVDLAQVADNHPDTNPVSEQSEPQKPQVFLRQSTRLVAQSNSKKTRRSSESPITFLAMSSAENEGNSNNTFLIKEF